MMNPDVLLNPDGLDLNEASGVSRLKSTEFIHRRLMLIVKTLQETLLDNIFSSQKDIYLSTFAAHNDHIAPVELKSDFSIHSPLARRNRSSDELALWCEEVTIVEDPAELDSRELVPQSTNVSIKRQALQIDMSSTKDGRSW